MSKKRKRKNGPAQAEHDSKRPAYRIASRDSPAYRTGVCGSRLDHYSPHSDTDYNTRWDADFGRDVFRQYSSVGHRYFDDYGQQVEDENQRNTRAHPAIEAYAVTPTTRPARTETSDETRGTLRDNAGTYEATRRSCQRSTSHLTSPQTMDQKGLREAKRFATEGVRQHMTNFSYAVARRQSSLSTSDSNVEEVPYIVDTVGDPELAESSQLSRRCTNWSPPEHHTNSSGNRTCLLRSL